MITPEEAYWELVRYHFLRNYPASIRAKEKDGREDKSKHGFGLVMDGRTTLEQLLDKRIVTGTQKYPTEKIRTPDELYEHITTWASKDGASVLSNYRTNRGIILNEALSILNEKGVNISTLIPEELQIDEEYGTRLSTLIAVPQLLPKTHVIMIRQTAHNGTGLGPVIYANKNGVERAAIFRVDEKSTYRLDRRGTILEDIHYQREGNKVIETKRYSISPEQFIEERAA